MLYELTKEMVEMAEKNPHPFFRYRGPSLVEFEKAELEGMKYVATTELTGSTMYAKGRKELSLEEIMLVNNVEWRPIV